MGNPYRHPISTPVPELQGIATIAAPSQPVADVAGEDDTVAFIQEWMVSGDYEPDQWHKDFAAAIDERSAVAHQRYCKDWDIRKQTTTLTAERDAAVARAEAMGEALRPFADYADPRQQMPASMPVTNGSSMARKQITMGDCYAARAALSAQSTDAGNMVATTSERQSDGGGA